MQVYYTYSIYIYKKTNNMNYREKIQSMVEQINKLYNDAEWLRDIATGEEKEYWNAHRKIFYDASKPLRALDNSLSNSRAQTCLCDDFKTEFVKKNCPECSTPLQFKKMTCYGCKDVWYKDNYCSYCENDIAV